ncbi:MAG: hypothetical protein ACAI35_13085 [Candidatus Methylacidiphilales bacterium]
MSGPKVLSLQAMEYKQEICENTEKCERILARYRRLAYEYAALLGVLQAKGKDISGYDQIADAEQVTEEISQLMGRWEWELADKACFRHLNRAEKALALAKEGQRDQAETFFRDLGEATMQQNAVRCDVATLEAMLAGVAPDVTAGLAPTLSAIRTARDAMMDLATLGPSDGLQLGESMKQIAKLRGLVASARDTLHQESSKGHAQSVLDQLRGNNAAAGSAPGLQQVLADAAVKRALRTGGATAGALTSPLPAAAAPTPPPSAVAELARLDALLARIAVLADTTAWQGIAKKAHAVRTEEDTSRRRMLLEDLMMEGGRLLKQLAETNTWREQIGLLLDRLSAAPAHTEITAMRAKLDAVLRSGLVQPCGPLEQEVTAAIAKAREAEDRREKRRIVAESLAELGYEPIDGMETAWMEGGKLVVARPDEEYGVEVVANADASKVQTTMVRFAESTETTERQRLADEEREMSWCTDYAEVRRKMAANGLRTAMEMQLPSGQHPVRVVVAPEKAKKRSRSSKAGGLKAREM